MSDPELSLLPARSGRAVRLARGQAIKIVNTHGQQVVDTWAFNAADIAEFMSMEHLRQVLTASCRARATRSRPTGGGRS